MMEPVAWRNEHGAVTNFKHGADAWRDAGIWSEPLVPLSDAEARIAELRERLAEVDKEACDGRVIVGRQKMLMLEAADEITRLTDRAEAAEALLKEAFLRGFMSSAEGYNGEYPFDLDEDCLNSQKWVEMRDRVLSALKEKP